MYLLIISLFIVLSVFRLISSFIFLIHSLLTVSSLSIFSHLDPLLFFAICSRLRMHLLPLLFSLLRLSLLFSLIILSSLIPHIVSSIIFPDSFLSVVSASGAFKLLSILRWISFVVKGRWSIAVIFYSSLTFFIPRLLSPLVSSCFFSLVPWCKLSILSG